MTNAIKILSSEQIRRVDKETIEKEPVSSIDLMERASRAFVAWFVKTFNLTTKVKIFCGIGNNGGDGLAIARLLLDYGYKCECFVIGDPNKATNDFKTNAGRLDKIESFAHIDGKVDFPPLELEDVVIDALFGSGLSRPLGGVYADLVNYINGKKNRSKVAVDIPSGLYADSSSLNNTIFQASETICFQIPKLAFFLPESAPYCGQVELVDIGLNEAAVDAQNSHYHLSTQRMIAGLIKTRDRFMHKGQAGRALIVAGSYGKMGAAVLAVKSCLRSGAGLVTALIPECGYDIMQSSVPEAMVEVTDNLDELSVALSSYDTIGVGPGLGTSDTAVSLIEQILKATERPIVLDADALNILSKHQDWLKHLPANSILTPHPKEFQRLAGNWTNDFEKLELQRKFCQEHEVIVLLKGAYTSICDTSGDIYFNPTGNPGMATGGSGDVLTGIITGLLGQGYNSLESCLLGGYLHGLSGDLYTKEYSEEGLIAGDLVDFLPRAFAKAKNE